MLATHPSRAVLRSLIAVASALVALSLLAAPTAALADDIDAISGAPSDGVGTDARTSFSYQLSPGQQITDYFLARNTGTTALTATVFATDAFNATDGGFSLLDTSATPTDAGSWVTFDGASKVEIPLAPGESKVVTFVLTVPDTAGPGDHAAGILVSVQKGDGKVLIDRRVGTRLYVRVPGDLQPILAFSDLTATYAPTWNPFAGTTTINTTVKNNGNVALSADALVGVKGPFGIALGSPERASMDELLPGGEVSLSYEIPGIGQWLFLTPYVTLQPTISDEALNPGPLNPLTRDTLLIAVPWWLLGILLVAGIIILISRIRARRDEKAAVAWIAYTEAEAERRALEQAEEAKAMTPVSGPEKR